jgi:hypothetical protein
VNERVNQDANNGRGSDHRRERSKVEKEKERKKPRTERRSPGSFLLMCQLLVLPLVNLYNCDLIDLRDIQST